jgi:hypothetical protein
MPHRQTFVLSGELRFPSAEHLVGAPKILRATVRPMSVFDYSLASLGKRGPLMTRDTWWYGRTHGRGLGLLIVDALAAQGTDIGETEDAEPDLRILARSEQDPRTFHRSWQRRCCRQVEQGRITRIRPENTILPDPTNFTIPSNQVHRAWGSEHGGTSP